LSKGDIYKILKDEHDNVKELFKETIETGNTSKFPEIKKQLEVHMANEESFLYPPMEFVDEEMIKKNKYEHELAWNKLLYLDNAQSDKDWMENMKELNNLIIKHVEREEKELFPKASETLSEEAEEDIIKLMEEEKSTRM
jgi:hemerythrin superfamily protein